MISSGVNAMRLSSSLSQRIIQLVVDNVVREDRIKMVVKRIVLGRYNIEEVKECFLAECKSAVLFKLDLVK